MLQTSYDDEFIALMDSVKEEYGQELLTIDGIGSQLDINKFATSFFNSDTTIADTSVDSNSNVSEKNSIVFDKEFSKPIQRLNSYYLLWKELKKLYGTSAAKEIIENQLTGVFYINDFSNIGLPYCFNYTTYDVALMGLPMINKIISKPPKYFFSFKSQVEQFIVIASNSTLGATGIADFLLVAAYYVDRIYRTGNDGSFNIPKEEIRNYIKDQLTSFIYTVNQPNRGNQSAFTNISLYDDVFLDKLCSDYRFPDGRTPKKETVKWMQELFIDIMNEELERTPITFPVTTACMSIENKEILDTDFLKLISEKDEKFGFINIYMGATSTLSSCCRLRSDMTKLNFNTLGGSSSKIGSLGVVTLNLPRIAFTSKTTAQFVSKVRKYTTQACMINNAKREVLLKRIELNAMPLYQLGFMSLDAQYSTVGFTGLYEAVCELTPYLDTHTEYIEISSLILESMNDIILEWDKITGYPHNIEQTPSETSAIKLADKDKYIGLDPGVPFYSNQFFPLQQKADMLDRIYVQGQLDNKCSGGSILHINIDNPITAKEAKELTELCASAGVIYYAKNYVLNRCEAGHMTAGTRETCWCGKSITDKYTRVVG